MYIVEPPSFTVDEPINYCCEHPSVEVKVSEVQTLVAHEGIEQMNHPTSRIIIHCDLDAFFAAVETLHHGLDPSIPLIIGSDPMLGQGRGIVSTCNYVARSYGIHSAMPISEAWRRCPAAPFGPAIYIGGTRMLYTRASKQVMLILRNNSTHFEQASIDEAYLDVTELVGRDWDEALGLAKKLQDEIYSKLHLTASFGIAPTKIIAKMASEVNKPNGIHRVMPGEIGSFLANRPLRDVPGIGPKTATQLAEWGLIDVADAYGLGRLALSKIHGDRFAHWLISVVEGETSSEVNPIHSRKSISKEHTFGVDQTDMDAVLERLSSLVEQVLERAHSMEVSARLAEVKIRYKGFETHTHGQSIPVAMDDIDVFQRLAKLLFATHVDTMLAIRLIGFKIGHLEYDASRQLTLESSLDTNR